MKRLRLLVVGLALAMPALVQAQPSDDTFLDEELPPPPAEVGDGGEEGLDDFGFGEEFELEARDRVISASRTESTIQEVPAIVTVITREEIRARGFRTIIEVLETVPGFESRRPEGGRWTVETFARGTPRTILVLINGINVIEPLRNQLTLDRKLPLDIVERVEVISGPGGVLWGSNALLGVVNITTVNGRDLDGWSVRAGGGSGPGEMGAVDANAAYGGEIFEDVYLYTNLNFYSSRDSVVTLEEQKVVGVLPEPAVDGISLMQPGRVETDNGRGYLGSLYLDLRGGPFTFNAFIQSEEMRRPQAFGGAVVTEDLRTPDEDGNLQPPAGSYDLENVSNDSLWWINLNYRDRFADDDFGLSATLYYVRWVIRENPFGSFPPSDLLPQGLATVFDGGELYRLGLNLDADYLLPANNHVIFGGEVSGDFTDDVKQTFPVNPTDPDPDRETVTDTLVFAEQRVIGALYVSDEWRASDNVALNAGARLQLSNTYDPTPLFAAALVWNLFSQTFLKLNYAEGFRPPSVQSTNVNGNIGSGISFTGNPNLDVERSRAVEAEINSVLMDRGPVVDRWFMRVDYSFSVLDDLISQESGTFVNAGTRFIHSIEFLTRIAFVGQHELSATYYFVAAEDDAIGPIRNIPNHTIGGHGRLQIIPNILHLSADVIWYGPREDANRRVSPDAPDGEITSVFPTDVYVQQIPSTLLLRVGLRAEAIEDVLSIGVFGYNILNETSLQGDYFFDDRVQLQAQVNPRWSVYATAEARF